MTVGSYGEIDLGPQTGFYDQPYVDIELFDPAALTIETLTEGGAGSNEVQRVELPAQQPTGGRFTLSYDEECTGAINNYASAAAVRIALEGLSPFSPGDMAVTGANGGPWTIEFQGSYANTNVLQLGGAFGLGPYDSGFGIHPYKYLLLDTGANSALIVSDAAADLEANGYQTVAIYEEAGVAGSTFFDVSDGYRFSVTGTDGTWHWLYDDSGAELDPEVHSLSSPDVEFGMPAQLGGIPGLVGMPAMADWVTTLDMEQVEQMVKNPTDDHYVECINAIRRAQTLELMEGFFKDVIINEDGGSTSSFSANNQIAVNYSGGTFSQNSGAADVSLNVDKLFRVRKLLSDAEIYINESEASKLHIAVTEEEVQQLMASVIGTDNYPMLDSNFSSMKVTLEKAVDTINDNMFYWQGFHFHVLPSLYFDVDENGDRRIPVWIKSGMTYGMKVNVRSEILRLPNTVESTKIQALTRVGALRKHDAKVYEIKCHVA